MTNFSQVNSLSIQLDHQRGQSKLAELIILLSLNSLQSKAHWLITELITLRAW